MMQLVDYRRSRARIKGPPRILVPTLRVGTHCRDAPRRFLTAWRRRASHHGAPTRSVGARGHAVFRGRCPHQGYNRAVHPPRHPKGHPGNRKKEIPMRLRTVLAALATLSSCFSVPFVDLFASDWPHWLGPNNNGSSPETGLLTNWPAKGPKVLWRQPGGEGYSAVAVADGRAIT